MPCPSIAAVTFVVAAALCLPSLSAAQTPDYVFPDAPAQSMVVEGEHFWFKPVFAWIGDYTAFSQDQTSLTQVGTQENARELRAGRVGFTLRSKGPLKWDFYFTADYQEARTRDGPVFQIYDVRVSLPIGPMHIYIGKQKEQFSYELVELSAVLPQQERILLPFFPTRDIGVNLTGQLAGGRMTWAAGVFNDWLTQDVAFSKNGSAATGRVTALAWESTDKRDYVHLGLGLRHELSDEGTMRFAGRPESNVADKYMDTKRFVGNHVQELSLEGLWSLGRVSVLAEHIGAWVDAPISGDPHFSGYYVAGSWVVTGESRPYIRASGVAGAILPKRRFGAAELVAKYSHVDLTDGPIDGGILGKWHFGVNWWASAQWKVGLSYGDADLDKAGLLGDTRMWLTRVQWLY